MPEKSGKDDLSDDSLRSILMNARFLFWACPDRCRGFVSWEHTTNAAGKKVAIAKCEKCGKTSKEFEDGP